MTIRSKHISRKHKMKVETMDEFLAIAKDYQTRMRDHGRVRVVLGNPTCDLDSAVCALALGFLFHMATKEDNSTVVVPVLNVSRDEFRLRTEVVHYLDHCGVSRDLLKFRNEIDLRELRDSGQLELVLVDHHTLPPADAELADTVHEVVDHRPQDPAWPWEGRKVTLETVGSCASLVARAILERNPEAMTPQLARLLRGPILIDTANFSTEADRARPLDHEIMAKLETIIGSDGSDRTQLYQTILEAKTDISSLTPADLLIRDLKVVNGVPIPGFPILVKDFLELRGAPEALESFCQKHNYTSAVLIGLDLKDDNVTRDIAVYSTSGTDVAANKLIEALTASTSPSLQLTEAKRVEQQQQGRSIATAAAATAGGKLLVLYKQANVRASRKQILPIIQSASLSA